MTDTTEIQSGSPAEVTRTHNKNLIFGALAVRWTDCSAARPASSTFTRPVGSILTTCGERSPCSVSWNDASRIAFAIRTAISSAVRSGAAPVRRTHSSRDSPSARSRTR